MDVRATRLESEVSDAAKLMRGLAEANMALYDDDRDTIEEYYRGSWFFSGDPEIPPEYCPPHGDVLLAYLGDIPAGTVAICRLDKARCELKSMFVAPGQRRQGVALALCETVISLARSQGYRAVRLTTGERQKSARRLYGQLGFEVVAPWHPDPPEGYDYYELALS